MSRDADNEDMEYGIRALLGREEYPEPEKKIECKHVSDGFIYESTPKSITLRCQKCTMLYDVDRDGY